MYTSLTNKLKQACLFIFFCTSITTGTKNLLETTHLNLVSTAIEHMDSQYLFEMANPHIYLQSAFIDPSPTSIISIIDGDLMLSPLEDLLHVPIKNLVQLAIGNTDPGYLMINFFSHHSSGTKLTLDELLAISDTKKFGYQSPEWFFERGLIPKWSNITNTDDGTYEIIFHVSPNNCIFFQPPGLSV